MNVLDIKMQENDAGAATIRDYLKKLLSTLWEKKHLFDGKRPIKNSNWESEIKTALIKGGAIAGSFDENGYINECDNDAAQILIREAIADLH